MAEPEKKDERPRGLQSRWAAMSPRMRWVLGTASFVVLLVAVLLVGSALSTPTIEQPTGTTTGTANAQQSELAYQSALKALESQNTTQAVALLERALELDPSNSAAKSELAQVEAERKRASASTTEPAGSSDATKQPEKPAEDPAFLKPVKSLKKLLPKRAEGFSLGTPVSTKTDATIAGTPAGAEVVASKALWTVHDRKTPKGANTFIKKVSKELYPEDAGTTTIDGTVAYFGTDGTRFATVAYVRGRYVFEVVLTTLSGSPAELKTQAESAAKAFPDKL